MSDVLVLTDRQVELTVPTGETRTVLHRLAADGTYSLRLSADAGATVTIVTVQPPGVHADLRQDGVVGDGARLRWQTVSFGEGVQELSCRLTGADARVDSAWAFLATREQQLTLRVRSQFEGPRGSGRMTMRGIAAERAQVACDGLIAIGLHGGGTDTYLTQEVLMLDPTARIDARPALDIRTNDVKASHSATVARVTPEDLFYGAARGIAETTMRQMIAEGFLEEMICALPEELQRECRGWIEGERGAQMA